METNEQKTEKQQRKTTKQKTDSLKRSTKLTNLQPYWPRKKVRRFKFLKSGIKQDTLLLTSQNKKDYKGIL